MSYKLIEENLQAKQPFRIYKNEKTGTEVKTVLIYDETTAGRWWGFTDLFKIPVMRISMAKHISDLYNIGLTLKDILDWCKQEKELLKGNDSEKYEKLFALVLEKEKTAKFTADPVKQHLALSTVYVLNDEEQIDYFDEDKAEEKMKIWAAFPNMVAFFLTWYNEHIQRYMKTLEKISTTVSKVERLQQQQQGRLNG